MAWRDSACRRSRRIAFRARAFSVLLLLAAGATAAPEAQNPPLNARHADWLDMVDVLITEEERAYFLSIRADYRRDAFIEEFWKQRDPNRWTVTNELRRQWETRADVARTRFPTLSDARSWVLMLKGEPYTLCYDRGREVEIWYYDEWEHEVFPLTFFTNVRGEPYEVWTEINAFRPAKRAGNRRFSLRERCDGVNPALAKKRINRRYDDAFPYAMAVDRFLPLPEPPATEWVAAFAASSTDLPAGAETFEVDFDLAFPGYHQQRTVVEGVVVVPAGVAASLGRRRGEAGRRAAGPPEHRFLITGEVVRDDRLFGKFRYNFEVPASPRRGAQEAQSDAPQPIPLVFQRYLRPGPVRMLLKIEDLFGRRFARVDASFEVPRIETEADVPRREDTELMRLLAEANDAAARGEHILRLVAPARTVITGLARFKTFVSGDFDRVTFFLDGKPVLTKRAAPYSVELDLGNDPTPQLLRASGFDADGEELAFDEIQLNPGGQRFRARLVEPRSNVSYRHSVPVEVDVQAPDGKSVDRVEIYLDERRVATLYQPPFAQPLVLPQEQAMVYVRALAYLTDGNSTEDVVFINAPDYLEEIDVQIVEVYATVHDKQGQPVLGLGEEAFEVHEDGAPQELRRFEWVSDLPIHAALLLDVSASMADSLKTVTAAALDFVEQTLKEKDRLALLTFNEQPRVAQGFTNDVAAVQGSLAALRSDGGTAIYDSLVFALHYFHGVRGQKALLLLSDGQDESSAIAFDDTLEYARRAAVTVYAIGLGEAASKRAHRRVLQRIAGETGGRAFFLESVSQLEAIYATIQEELRSQYLLVYQSTSTRESGHFRRVEVIASGYKVRAMSGYYP